MHINWPAVSILVNVLIALGGFLVVRWVGGIVESLKQQILIAILQLQNDLSKQYATQPQLDKVEEDLRREINLAERIEAVPENTAALLVRRGLLGRGDTQTTVSRG